LATQSLGSQPPHPAKSANGDGSIALVLALLQDIGEWRRQYCSSSGPAARWVAPDIVKAILEDALPDHLTLFDLAVDPPALWEEQRLRIWSG